MGPPIASQRTTTIDSQAQQLPETRSRDDAEKADRSRALRLSHNLVQLQVVRAPKPNHGRKIAKSRLTRHAVAKEPYVLRANSAAESVGSSSIAAHMSAR